MDAGMQTTTGNTFDHNCLTFDEYDDFHLVIGDQTAPEIFWSWSVQHWARSIYNKIDPQPLISQAFYDLGIVCEEHSDIDVAFAFCLDLIVSFSTSGLSIGCHGCKKYGLLELITLGCITFHQEDHEVIVKQILYNYMSDVPAEASSRLLGKIARAFANKGIIFPIRSHYFDLVARKSSGSDRVSQFHKTIN